MPSSDGSRCDRFSHVPVLRAYAEPELHASTHWLPASPRVAVGQSRRHLARCGFAVPHSPTPGYCPGARGPAFAGARRFSIIFFFTRGRTADAPPWPEGCLPSEGQPLPCALRRLLRRCCRSAVAAMPDAQGYAPPNPCVRRVWLAAAALAGVVSVGTGVGICAGVDIAGGVGVAVVVRPPPRRA